MEKKLSTVTMSSADWQRNEQRHETRERRLCTIRVLLVIALLATNLINIDFSNNSVTETVGETYET